MINVVPLSFVLWFSIFNVRDGRTDGRSRLCYGNRGRWEREEERRKGGTEGGLIIAIHVDCLAHGRSMQMSDLRSEGPFVES